MARTVLNLSLPFAPVLQYPSNPSSLGGGNHTKPVTAAHVGRIVPVSVNSFLEPPEYSIFLLLTLKILHFRAAHIVRKYWAGEILEKIGKNSCFRDSLQGQQHCKQEKDGEVEQCFSF
jgi:hypothetical protein